MGSKLNNGYVGSNELEYVNTRGYSDTSGKGILSGTKNYLEEEKKQWRHESDWVRNPKWLEMPEIPEGEEKVCVLVAILPNVSDEINTYGVNFRDNYEVDWGDGTTGAYTSTTTNTHVYDFNSIDVSTETDEGYRQVIITVTPQAGQNLTRMYWNITSEIDGIRSEYYKNHLDMVARLPNTSCTYTQIPISQKLERVIIHEWDGSGTCQSMFQSRRALEYVEIPDAPSATSVYLMFNSCVKLKYPPYFDTSGVTEFRNMFGGCDDLRRVPKYDFSSATSVRQMFVGCRDLRYVPDLNLTSSCTDARELFNSCFSLRECPDLGDTTGIQLAEYMFQYCYGIKEIELNLPSCTNAIWAFRECVNLEKAKVTFNNSIDSNLSYLFYGCEKLQTADLQGTSICTVVPEMFRGCTRLRGVTMDTSSVTNSFRLFRYCSNLRSYPTGMQTSTWTYGDRIFEENLRIEEMNNVDFSNLTSMPYIFSYMRSLREVTGITGPSVTHTWEYCPLEADSIRNIINGLPTVVGQTVSFYRTAGIVSGGVTAGDIAVATGKGWTVTT